MGVVCSAIANIFAAIGRGIAGLFRIIADVCIAIVNAITSVFVGICDCLGDLFCCRGCGGAKGGRTGRRSRAVV